MLTSTYHMVLILIFIPNFIKITPQLFWRQEPVRQTKQINQLQYSHLGIPTFVRINQFQQISLYPFIYSISLKDLRAIPPETIKFSEWPKYQLLCFET